MIPTAWELVKLKDTSLTIIDGDRGNNYPKSDDFTDEGYCLFLSAKNITKNGFRLDEKQFISKEKDNLLRKGKLKDLDIIITTRGSVGHIAFNENIKYENMRINSGMVILRNIDRDINQNYVYKLFASSVIQRQIKKIAFGSAQPQLTVKEINNLKIPLPPLKEQEKTADILSTTDEKIDAIASQIQKAQTLKKGLLQKLLSEGIGHSEFKDSEIGKIPESWEVVELNSLLELLTDFEANGSFADVKANVNVFDNSGFAWYVRATDLEKKTNLSNVKYVDKDSYEFLRKTTLYGNELLITKRGEIGKVYFFNEKGVKATLAPNLYLLKLNNKVTNSKYLFYYFISSIGQKALKRLNASSALGALYKVDVKGIKLAIPLLSEQNKIVDILSVTDEKLEVLRAKKEKYETFKKGLLQKLLSGEVRV